jgi:hypothetical protein
VVSPFGCHFRRLWKSALPPPVFKKQNAIASYQWCLYLPQTRTTFPDGSLLSPSSSPFWICFLFLLLSGHRNCSRPEIAMPIVISLDASWRMRLRRFTSASRVDFPFRPVNCIYVSPIVVSVVRYWAQGSHPSTVVRHNGNS